MQVIVRYSKHVDTLAKPMKTNHVKAKTHVLCTLVWFLFPHRTTVHRASLASASAIDRRGAGVIRSTFVSTILCVAIIAG